MIIDRRADVVPPRYTSKEQRGLMGGVIGRSNRDDVLEILVWTAECRAVRQVRDGWKSHAARVRREQEEAERRVRAARLAFGSSQATLRSAGEAASDLASSLEPELAEAQAAVEESTRLHANLTHRIGEGEDSFAANHHQTENAGPLWRFLEQAEQRLEALLAEDHQRLHTLALRDRQSQFEVEVHPNAPCLDSLDHESGVVFRQKVRELMEYEGNTLLPSLREGLELDLFRTPSGRTLAIMCCHHKFEKNARQQDNWEWLSSIPQQALRDGRSADADNVAVITNIRFNIMSQKFAEAHSILLLDRGSVRRWIEWGIALNIDTRLPKHEAT